MGNCWADPSFCLSSTFCKHPILVLPGKVFDLENVDYKNSLCTSYVTFFSFSLVFCIGIVTTDYFSGSKAWYHVMVFQKSVSANSG